MRTLDAPSVRHAHSAARPQARSAINALAQPFDAFDSASNLHCRPTVSLRSGSVQENPRTDPPATRSAAFKIRIAPLQKLKLALDSTLSPASFHAAEPPLTSVAALPLLQSVAAVDFQFVRRASGRRTNWLVKNRLHHKTPKLDVNKRDEECDSEAGDNSPVHERGVLLAELEEKRRHRSNRTAHKRTREHRERPESEKSEERPRYRDAYDARISFYRPELKPSRVSAL